MRKKVLIYFPDTAEHNFTPPYEILFQAEALKSFNIEIILADNRTDDVFSILKKQSQDISLLIISTIIKYTSITIRNQIEDGFFIASEAKKYSGIPVLWTGLAASILENKILNDPHSDFIIKGTSEESLIQFIDSFINNRKYADIPNLGFRQNGIAVINKCKIINAWKKWGNFNPDYIDMGHFIHDNTLDYLVSTGCVNSCSFCSVPLIYEKKWQHNSIDNISRHLKCFFNTYQELDAIHFRDDNFLVNKHFIFELFESLSMQNIRFIWSTQTSINVLNNYSLNELIKLRSYGCNNISVGIESGDSFVLKKLTKSKSKTTKQTSISSIKKLIKAGIVPSITSIINFPYHQGRDFNKTLRLLMKLKLIFPDLSLYCTVFQPIPGTEVYKDVLGDIKTGNEVVFENIWISKRRINTLKKFEYFYFIFDNKDFYKKMPDKLKHQIKWINLIFSPLIRLRFRLGITSFFWEYSFISKKINKIRKQWGIKEIPGFYNTGIRHLTNVYNFGFKNEKEQQTN